jgi:hypothetical protein
VRCEHGSMCMSVGIVLFAFLCFHDRSLRSTTTRPAAKACHIVYLHLPVNCLFVGKFDLTSAYAFVVQFPRTPAGAALRAAQCRADLRAVIHHRRRHVSDTSHRVYSLRPAAAAMVLTADYCSPTTPSCVYCSQRHVAWADPSLPTK